MSKSTPRNFTRTMTRATDRAIQFLRASGGDTAIRDALLVAGFNLAERDLGWALIHGLTEAAAKAPAGQSSEGADAFRAAEQALQTEGAAFIRRARAALERLHPEVAEVVFAGVDAQMPMVLAIASVLTRLSAAGDADLAAARDTLALRGLGPVVCDRLADLVQSIERGVPALAPAGADAPRANRERDLLALQAWHRDWAETARACIHQRSQLIRLGLAQRRAVNSSPAESTGTSAGTTETTESTETSAEPLRATVATSNAA